MFNRISGIFIVLFAAVSLSACAPLIGAAGVVLVDQGVEQERGGDGLF